MSIEWLGNFYMSIVGKFKHVKFRLSPSKMIDILESKDEEIHC